MSRTNIRFVLFLMLICWLAAAVPASAQHFREIPNRPLSQIAAGRTEVWGLDDSQIYRFNPSTKDFGQISGSLTQIAVGGGTLLQPDEVWGINGGIVYRFNSSTDAFSRVAGGKQCKICVLVDFTQIAVGKGEYDNCHPYEVWGLAYILGTLYPYRYNYCTDSFDQIALPQFDQQIACGAYGCLLTNIWVGASDIWVLDDFYELWHYQYTPVNQPGVTQNWLLVTFGQLMQLTVGVNDVWGIDVGVGGNPYRLESGNNVGNGVGQFIEEAPVAAAATQMTQIAAGGDGVWAIKENGQVLRFDPVYLQFRQIPTFDALAAQIAVGSGAGVWLIDTRNRVYTFVRP
jgi:hypothetical protein